MKYLSFLFIIFFSSCNNKGLVEEHLSCADSASTEAAESLPAVKASIQFTPPAITSEDKSDAINNSDRKIIKNANLNFESNNPVENILYITQLVSKNQGYIVSNNQRKYGERIEYEINFKVPFIKFDALLPDIEKNSGTLINRSISSDDVTEEFYDNESRLKAKKELETRYLQLIKQAKSIKDMLEIEEKLSEVRTDIEQIQGRQRFLDNNTQYSNFEITITDKQSTLSNNYFVRVWKSIKNGFDNFFNSILWFIELIPFILIVFGIYKFIRIKNIGINIFKKKKD